MQQERLAAVGQFVRRVAHDFTTSSASFWVMRPCSRTMRT